MGIDKTTIDEGATIKAAPDENTDTVKLIIEDETDITPNVKRSVTDKAKDAFSGLFKANDVDPVEESKPKKGRGRPSGSNAKGVTKSNVFQSQASIVAAILLFIMAMTYPPKWKQKYTIRTNTGDSETFTILPTTAQSTNIVMPLLRIADRHIPMGETNPDMQDLVLCMGAVVAYGITAAQHLQLLELALEEERRLHEQGKNATTRENYSFTDPITSNGPSIEATF